MGDATLTHISSVNHSDMDMVEEELEPSRFKLHPGANTDPHYWVSRALNLLLA